jgi:hypothetical protein
MTDDQSSPPTLDDVRQRFLDAETHLAGIGSTLERLSGAAAGIGQARQSLDGAGTALADLATNLGETANELEANATALRQGVDAIRLGDPAEVLRLLHELDASFGAFQRNVIERFTAVDASHAEFKRAIGSGLEESRSLSRRAQVEMRVGLVGIAMLSIAVIVLLFVRA